MSDSDMVHSVQDNATLDDARRRLILALRGLTLQKEREERNARAVREWTDELNRHVATVRRWERRRRTRRTVLFLGAAALLIMWLSGILGDLTDYWWLMFFFVGGGAAADVSQVRTEQAKLAANLARARDPRA